MILQAIVGGVAAVAVASKFYGDGSWASSASGRRTTRSGRRAPGRASSFRDPDSRVFYAGGEVRRALRARAGRLGGAGDRAVPPDVAAGRLVATERVAEPDGAR